MVIALLSLWVADIPLVASLGYASAFAVFTAMLAAVTLLPATLSLAGRAVWWLPGWLSGLLPHVDIEGEPEPPAPAPPRAPRPATVPVDDDGRGDRVPGDRVPGD